MFSYHPNVTKGVTSNATDIDYPSYWLSLERKIEQLETRMPELEKQVQEQPDIDKGGPRNAGYLVKFIKIS